MTNPVCCPLVSAIETPQAASTAALITFLVYTLGVFVLAWFSHGILTKSKFLSEYFLGSRGLGVIAFTLTYGATSASAGSFAGFPALVYTHGWVLAVWIASYMVVPICGMGLLGKRMNQVARKTGSITIPDVLRNRFESAVPAVIGTFMIVFLLSFYLIPQFKLASLILQQLLAGIPVVDWATAEMARVTAGVRFVEGVEVEYLFCLVLFALLTVAYTTFGGFRAVVWTDVMQGLVMVFGVVVMLSLALWEVGGLSEATKKMAQMTPPVVGEVRFEKTDTAVRAGLDRVVADTWFAMMDPSGGERRLFRTNESAVFSAEKASTAQPDAPEPRSTNWVKVTQVTTPFQVKEILTGIDDGTVESLPSDITPYVRELKQYARGANQPGAYVSGPGPSTPTQSEAGFLPLGLAVSFFFFWAISGTGQPGNMVRLMAFRSSKTLRRGIALLSIYFGLIYFPLVVIFCCARVLVPGLDQTPDRIMPVMAFTLSEVAKIPWLAGLLVAAPFAAAMSTVDSFMLIISSALVRDVYQQHVNPAASQKSIKWLSYATTLIIGVVVTFGAMNPPQFLQYLIVFTGGGLAVTFLFPISLALYWPRFNTSGAVASMLSGFVTYLALYIAGYITYGTATPVRPLSFDPLIWGFAASLLTGVGVALVTDPPPSHLVKRFFYQSS